MIARKNSDYPRIIQPNSLKYFLNLLKTLKVMYLLLFTHQAILYRILSAKTHTIQRISAIKKPEAY
jgi:hypothetical protein